MRWTGRPTCDRITRGWASDESVATEPAGLDVSRPVSPEYGQNQAVSTTFGYLPVIIVAGQAFCGFDEEVREAGGVDRVTAS